MMIASWLQPLFSALINVALATLIGVVLLRPLLPLTATKTAALAFTINRYATALWLISLLAYLCAATFAMTDTNLRDFPAAAWLVLTQSHLGAMIWLSLAAWLLLMVALTLSISAWLQRCLLILSFITLAYARAATGHAADHGWISFAIFNHTLHILAAATWISTVSVGALLTSHWQTWQTSERNTFAHRVSETATLAFVIVICSGLLNILRTLGNALHPWDFSYTWILLAKLAVIALAAGLGAWNRWRWMPRLDAHYSAHEANRFRVVLLMETAILCVALLLATVLGVTMPAQ